MSWNLTNYSSTTQGARELAFRTALFGSFEGRSANPDVIMAQEMISQTAANNFLNMLNAEQPGQWAAAGFINGNDTDNAFFYRTSKVSLVPNANAIGQTNVNGNTRISTGVTGGGSSNTNPPRDTNRFDIRLNGYNFVSDNTKRLGLYSSHMKAIESGQVDDNSRGTEASRIKADAATLGYATIVGGDFNTSSSFDQGFANLVSAGAGQFVDPTGQSGTWRDDTNRDFLWTQDPEATGMDDRFDFLLVGSSLRDGSGFEYDGDSTTYVPNGGSTWDDTGHSYTAWGNDGNFAGANQALNVNNNTQVGATIAQALLDTIPNGNGSGGHLPVFLDLLVPGEIGLSTQSIDFGVVDINSNSQRTFDLTNAARTIFGANGANGFDYTLNATGGFTTAINGGSLLRSEGSDNLAVILNVPDTGIYTGLLTITDTTSGYSRTINLTATVVPEPMTMLVVGAGLAGIALRRRRR